MPHAVLISMFLTWKIWVFYKENKSWNSSLHIYLQLPITFSLLDSEILLSTQFSNNLSLSVFSLSFLYVSAGNQASPTIFEFQMTILRFSYVLPSCFIILFLICCYHLDLSFPGRCLPFNFILKYTKGANPYNLILLFVKIPFLAGFPSVLLKISF